ncbi:hypothetical protein SPRG_16909 [Saprolegnia parasitica CBS 223.65]|uniref:Uncharacterized protein n=1 Tax=Saprolegnia parasitica (strain CBS 223.65) TaxID=695850 RepID=A0A067BGF0_SAPPC|nr:hypothetical protein SPRG_16909 [Saprolegnia parasitica CBS 223.65]KDO17484.1 hypothetical protein SPRG_16909 [Saprolegnia parasitica CBS 223.65]|eukprot:XP_012211810.1 hypothetical protein SPRG_16909 [Saprolegnia parasitica CBS 223.65]
MPAIQKQLVEHANHCMKIAWEVLVAMRPTKQNPLEAAIFTNSLGLVKLYTTLQEGMHDIPPKMVQYLLPTSDIDAITADGDYALYSAASNGFLEIVQLLVEHGATVAPTNVSGEPLLLRACGNGRVSVVDALLRAGADCNVTESYGHTALLVATVHANVEMLQLLAAHGANVAYVDQTSEPTIWEPTTAIALASSLGHAAVTTQKGSMALAHAVTRGHGDVLRALLPLVDVHATIVVDAPMSETGPDQALLNLAMTMPLHAVVACEAMESVEGHGDYMDALRALLECPSIDVNGRSEEANGATALYCACERGNRSLVRAIFEHPDCDINAADNDGNTPLHTASRKGLPIMVSYLLAQQPRINILAENKEGMTALQVAIMHAKRDVVAPIVP